MPSPQRDMHDEPVLQSGSFWQSAEQPSNGNALPSSHPSAPSTFLSPHVVCEHRLGLPLHFHPSSILQVAEQPSPAVRLPSSHSSGSTPTPSPQRAMRWQGCPGGRARVPGVDGEAVGGAAVVAGGVAVVAGLVLAAGAITADRVRRDDDDVDGRPEVEPGGGVLVARPDGGVVTVPARAPGAGGQLLDAGAGSERGASRGDTDTQQHRRAHGDTPECLEFPLTRKAIPGRLRCSSKCEVEANANWRQMRIADVLCHGRCFQDLAVGPSGFERGVSARLARPASVVMGNTPTERAHPWHVQRERSTRCASTRRAAECSANVRSSPFSVEPRTRTPDFRSPSGHGRAPRAWPRDRAV